METINNSMILMKNLKICLINLLKKDIKANIQKIKMPISKDLQK